MIKLILKTKVDLAKDCKTSTKTACTYFEHTILLRHWYHKYKAYLNIYIYFGVSHSAITPQMANKNINSSISNSPVTCAPLEFRGEMDNEDKNQEKDPSSCT